MYDLGVRALGTLDGLKSNLVSGIDQNAEWDSGFMKKDIPVRIACGYETIAFFGIKKFDDSGFHERVSNSQIFALYIIFQDYFKKFKNKKISTNTKFLGLLEQKSKNIRNWWPDGFFNVLKRFTQNSEKMTSLLKIQAAIDWFCRLKASASNS